MRTRPGPGLPHERRSCEACVSPLCKVVVERVGMIAERARPANRLTVLLPSLLGHLLYNPIIPTLEGLVQTVERLVIQRLKTSTEPQSRLGVGENVGVGRELGVEAGADGLEDRANLAAEDRQDADNDNSD